jgi:[ribosomal protein S5]-alanine N-acetyltransferase
MAHSSYLEVVPSAISQMPSTTPTPAPSRHRDWREGLPALSGSLITLRELRPGDAPSLLASIGTAEVTRLISPPPPTVEGLEKFVAWSQRQRETGKSIAYAVVLKDSDTVIGLFQVRALQPAFDIAEWGFALASDFWGKGIFMDAARLVLDFAFGVLGVHRLEARAALKNGRGNGALQKLGAVQEAVLRGSFLRDGVYLDQGFWTIMSDTWRGNREASVIVRIVH